MTDFLEHVKSITMQRIVSHMNGVGASVIQAYPMAEVASWPVQKMEADTAIAMGEALFKAQTLPEATSLTPFLMKVTDIHFGEAQLTDRMNQLWAKVLAVNANAEAWAALSAFVNGLRARAQDRINSAASDDEVYTIESETFSELESFRTAVGI